MDLEQLEALALGDDRAAALAALVPGSEAHDYWQAIAWQAAGRLAEVDRALAGWVNRHGHTAAYARVARRQRLLAASADLATHAEPLALELGVHFEHQPDVEAAAERYPNRLDPKLVDEATLLGDAIAGDYLDEVTPAALPALLTRSLDAEQRRHLLQRLERTGLPGLVAALAADLGERSSSGFGSLAVHHRLTTAELDELAALRPALRVDPVWVVARLARLRPADHVDWIDDLPTRVAHLDALAAATAALPPVFAPLRAVILYHRLCCDLWLGTYHHGRLRAYLGLPRTGVGASAVVAQRFARTPGVAIDQRTLTALGLPAIGDDSGVVVAYVHALLADGGEVEFGDVLDPAWLTRERAAARMLAGDSDPRWVAHYGAEATAALREQVQLELAPTNPARWGRDQPVALDVIVKHVDTLRVRVFRINVPAWFDATGREVDEQLDLDGLTAGWEEIRRFELPPMRRHQVRLELAACARPGTYVVELIGAGRACRAVIRRGDLRIAARPALGGTAVEVFDERGQPCPEAWLRLGGLTLRADARGTITVPFSTQPGTPSALVGAGDVAAVVAVPTRAERYQLAATWWVDRQALLPEATARVITRVTLGVGGQPAPLALVEEPYLEWVIADRRGVEVKQRRPLTLTDDAELVVELPLPAEPARIALAVGGRVRVVSEQRHVDVRQDATIELGTMHQTTLTAGLHLRPTPRGYRLALLGKTGEPRPGRAIAVALTHRALTRTIDVTLATDDRGEVDLGPLRGVTHLSATAGEVTQDLALGTPSPSSSPRIVAGPDDEVIVPTASDVAGEPLTASRWSVVELRGDAPIRDAAGHAVAEPGRVRLRGLTPGRYHVRAAEQITEVVIVAADVPGGRGWAAPCHGLFERSRRPATTATATVDRAGDLVIAVAHGSAATRVHVLATALQASPAVGGAAPPVAEPAVTWGWRPRSRYVSGRDIGDEYRYVLDRQHQPRSAGSLLDKPSLLLNPWALRTTATAVQHARGGGGFGAPAPAPSMRASSYAGQRGPALGQPSAAVAAVDFLAAPPVVIANLRPDGDGVVRLAAAALAGAAHLQVIVVDPTATTRCDLVGQAPPLAVRDLRLAAALPGDRHRREDRRLDPALAGATLAVADRATTRLELVDTVDKLYRALCALSGDATLARWDFLPRWASLDEAERLRLYSRHACHELALFIYGKDRPLFERALRPYLASKLHPTLVDRWLLGQRLDEYLAPWRLDTCNALELALLAQRHPEVAPALIRRLTDAVELRAPDPGADDRLVDTLVAGGQAAGGDPLADAVAADAPAELLAEVAAAEPPSAPRPVQRELKKKAARRARAADDFDDEAAEADHELAARDEAPPMFRAADRTQEWAEHNWFERRLADVGPELIPPARLWRDLAAHDGGRFLSPHIIDAAHNLPAAMAALAFVDLPFTAAPHRVVAIGAGAEVTTGSDALVARVELAEVDGPPTGAALLGQSYFRTDDRWQWDGAEQVEKYVTGELVTGVAYTCQVVITNPTSRRLRVSVLYQIPAGALAIAGALATATTRLELQPYQSTTIEYGFYFPHPGEFEHYGAQVTSAGGAAPAVLAAIATRRLTVVATPSALDPTSWPHLAQRGSLDEVCQFLGDANLARLDLSLLAWRCHEPAAFARLTATLAARRGFDDTIWSYALRHRDRARAAEWLAHRGAALGDLGPVFACELMTWEPVERAAYQHLEYAPLVNARAHRLGDRRTVPNDGLAAQWRAFLEATAHRPAPRAEDWLAAAHYLFALERPDDAARALARCTSPTAAAALQADYLAAYAAIGRGDLPTARALAAAHRDHPVDRWRTRFAALAAVLDEAAGAGPTGPTDPDNREQVLAAAAAALPTLAVRVDGDAVVLDHARLAQVELRYYRLDLELLFSRQPFLSGGGDRFGFIEPGRVEAVTLPALGPTRAPLPAELRRHSLVIEAVADGARAAITHFAHQLSIAVSAPYGRLQVRDAATGAVRPAAYVKCFARMRGGAVQFYKDGYTDLCGRFDYATLSTDDLDRVERFALLVVDDDAGATVLEAAPPPR
jgi:hypothetical protein